jgi:hypothetical protein
MTAEEAKKRQPTTERLARALIEAHAPAAMVDRARVGYYDDFKSDLDFPIIQLVIEATDAGLVGIANRARDGEFDSEKWESDEWAASPDGQETFKMFLDSPPPKKEKL